MEGKFFTRIGLGVLLLGIVLLTTWVSLYDEEYDVAIDGKIAKHSSKSKNLLVSGVVLSMIGYGMCIAGYAITTDFLNFSIKMPKMFHN